MIQRGADPGRIARIFRSPTFAILIVAPFFGESLSGSTPPFDLVLPWNLAFMAALYGSGALICREVARRYRLGLLGLILLGAAYGVYEEALVDRFWFYPKFWQDVGVGTYSEFWHTNVLLAAHLTVFHATVSICCSVLIVERLFPGRREQAWVGSRGLTIAVLALLIVVPTLYSELFRPSYLVLAVAAALCGLLIGAAFLAPRLSRPSHRPSSRRRGLAFVAFLCTASHFVLVYAIPSTDLPWAVGIVIALAPVVLGIVLIPRMAVGGPYDPDGLRVITGILSFFIVLDVAVGLGGRYDLIVGAVALTYALWWLRRRENQLPVPVATSPT